MPWERESVMLDILLWAAVLAVALYVVVKSSSYLLLYAERLSTALAVPPFIVGLLVVGFGTSLPELVTSIAAVTSGASEIVAGNVIGSNITNILLIAGLAAFAGGTLTVKRNLLGIDLPLFLGAALFLYVALMGGSFGIASTVIFLLALAFYVWYLVSEGRAGQKGRRHPLGWGTPLAILASLVLLYFGAEYTITAIVHLSDLLGIGRAVIAASVVALGTSLPELSVAIVGAREGKGDLVVGNLIGSNIFNIFAVMAIPRLFGPLSIPSSMLAFALPFLVGASLLFFVMMQENRLTKWEGGFLVLFYLFYLARLFGLG